MGFVSMARSIMAAALALAAAPAGAQEFEWTMLTGGPSGTYIRIGQDIAREAETCGWRLNVLESAGSLENFLGVRQRRMTQFGIVQSDVLEYLKTYEADDPAIARAVHGVQIAFPLYPEEVHVLARADVATLADLAGKRVAVGVEDSGTFLTASLVLDFAEVAPAERVTIGPSDSLEALLKGDIDAFFYVAGAPTALFQDPRLSEGGYRLLPLDHPRLAAVYQPRTIPAGTYPWQADPVEAVAVKAVLMTFAYDPRRNAYHRLSCEAVSEISWLIANRFEELKATGHPKWRDVDLADIPPGWAIGQCVNAGLDPDFVSSCRAAPAAATATEEPAANAVYRQRICAVVGGC
jgi:TRAP transporter TAXI family solute receptor